MKYLITAFTFLLLTAMSCKKNKDNQHDQLPPATQIGANTFGCLVNGKVYIPKGYSGTGTPNPKISFDFFNGKKIFSINTNHFENTDPTAFMGISFLDTLLLPGVYNFPEKLNFNIGWSKILNNCYTPANDTTIRKWGKGLITKFDKTKNIISGTFECKFKAQNCDTVFITNGRFDFKF